MRIVGLFICALVIACPARAGDIHRCVHPGGTVELRDRPCPPGTAEEPPFGDGEGEGGRFSTIPANRPPEALLERARRARSEAHEVGGGRPNNRSDSRERAARCAEYAARIDRIERRLRKGYSAGEGNALRAARRRMEHLRGELCR